MRGLRLASLLGAGLLAGCATSTSAPTPSRPQEGQTPVTQGAQAAGPLVVDSHVPPFASRPFEPFARRDAVAIAMREWRLWGQPVDDDPPDTRPPPLPEDKPERQPGLWQRVGEYWWTGQDPGEREASWTGIHDAEGNLFPAENDGQFAWSAAFISYIMRVDGAGPRFAYAPSHSTYINLAVEGRVPVVRAYAPNTDAPLAGDLICSGRDRAAHIRFRNLPAPPFPSHCDIVVAVAPGQLTVLGGNVDDAVTEKHVPISASGLLVGNDGQLLDDRYDWFVVLKILYDVG